METIARGYNKEIGGTYEVDLEKKTVRFDERQCLQYILRKGIDIYGNEFVMSAALCRAYYLVLYYAINDVIKQAEHGLDPRKGLLLMGEPLSGKTAILHLSKDFFPLKRSFKIYNIRKLTSDFALNGYSALTEVLSLRYPICLDGIGEEKEVKHFGNSCDIVLEVVEYHYQHRHEFKFPMLHITSRLSVSMLEKRYGAEFRVMLKGLVNVIVVSR